MFKVASTHSLDFAADRIVSDLVESAREQLGDDDPQAAVLFSAIDIDHEAVLQGLQEVYPGLQVIGATTDGELSSAESFQEDSTTAMFFASDTVSFSAGVATGVTESPAQAAREAVAAAKDGLGSEPSLCITTPEGLGPNAQRVLESLQDELGEELPIVGGLAGDQFLFEKTVQFFNGKTLHDSLPVLLLSGPVVVSHGVASGWAPLGDRVEITRSEGNVLYELGGKTATEFYRHYIGDGVVHDGVYPLAVYEEGGERFFLRAPTGSDEEEGSITFFGDVPSGAIGQMTRGEREAIVEGTRASIQEAYDSYTGSSKPSACLVFSCAGRHQILGTQTEREAEILREVVSDEVPICGFYTYGEIGPLAQKSPSRFHNDTVVTVLIGEDA